MFKPICARALASSATPFDDLLVRVTMYAIAGKAGRESLLSHCQVSARKKCVTEERKTRAAASFRRYLNANGVTENGKNSESRGLACCV